MNCRFQYPQKINVWAEILDNKILRFFFIEGRTLTCEKYHLKNKVIPVLAVLYPSDQNSNIPSNDLCYQQDGALAHYIWRVYDYLEKVFMDRWISNRSSIEWPVKSPGLTLLDYFFWGYHKSKVYVSRHKSIEDFKDRIRQ